MIRRWMAATTVGILVLAFTGCSKVAHVSGRVTMDGQQYSLPGEMVALTFTRDGGGINISTTVQPDGTFTVYGPEGPGLPPGKYTVGYYSDVEGGKKKIKDLTPEKSTAVFEMAAGDQLKLVIDVMKGTVTKQ